MPGVSPLATELGVNRKTVEAALRSLEEEGLLEGQGSGRKRRIVLPEDHAAPAVRVGILPFETYDRDIDFMIELRHRLDEGGHVPFYPGPSLCDLGMDPARVARAVKGLHANAWIVCAASREVLEWFAELEMPTFALAGRMEGVPMAGTKPDKAKAQGVATRHLLGLGHRRISFLCRHHIRHPEPGRSARVILGEIEAAGIKVGPFNLPEWTETREGFERALDALFRHTPPTALVLDESFLYYAAYHYLAGRGLRVPQDVSLLCTDGDPGFSWCWPSVAHISWDSRPVVRRVVNWLNNVASGKNDRRQTFTKAEFVEGGTVGPAPK